MIGDALSPGKVRKPYQSENRFLLIVNFDPELSDPNSIDLKIKRAMKRNNIHDPEMVRFIGVNDFIKLFKIEDIEQDPIKYRTELDKMLNNIKLAQKKIYYLKTLMKRYNEASDELKLLHERFGIWHNYIGDLV